MSPDTVTTKAKTAALDTAGTSRTLLKTPQVLARARSYFECSTLEGVDLEDDGGSGSAGSHWEERQLVTEFMQAAPSGMKNVKSEFTLALLEDSGWFKPDYSKAELMSWGYKKGCSFVDTCGPVSTSGFCAAMQGQDKQCSFDRSGMGLCKNDGQYMDGCPITRADYMCSDFKGDTSEVGFFGDKDRNKCGGIDCSGASYSDASACFESSLYNKIHGPGSSPSAVGCYQFCCKCNTAGLMIKDPSGTWRNCTRPSQSFTDIPGYSGVLFVPTTGLCCAGPRRAINKHVVNLVRPTRTRIPLRRVVRTAPLTAAQKRPGACRLQIVFVIQDIIVIVMACAQRVTWRNTSPT